MTEGPSGAVADCCGTSTSVEPLGMPAAPSGGLRILLVSTFDLGHQPFGLASPAAWLRAAGHQVRSLDVSVQEWDDGVALQADLIAFYLPMHTATRMATELISQARAVNARAHLCAYGLYAPVNVDLLKSLGVATILGGEFEESLTALADSLRPTNAAPRPELPLVSLDRLAFRTPDRQGLPALTSYATLRVPHEEDRTVGYTEATRGCKHLCRHCPVVPVYGGRFRVVQREVVLDDIDQQVREGAQHITFGDPDFLNGPAHAIAVVEGLHHRHPDLSYDATIKVEHLVARPDLLPVLRDTGCMMITSAIEAFDEDILKIFDKGHSRADVAVAATMLGRAGIALNATFVAFTPWTTREIYVDFLATLHELGMVANVGSVQLGIRLLITDRSRLLELPDVAGFITGFDTDGLCHRWVHPDPAMDELQEQVFAIVENAADGSADRAETFRQVCEQTVRTLGAVAADRLSDLGPVPLIDVPSLSEPWYCCAEPVQKQLKTLL